MGMVQVKPETQGDSGARSQSSSDEHSAVHWSTHSAPSGRANVSCLGIRRQVRDGHSRAGERIMVCSTLSVCIRHFRPTGLSSQPRESVMENTTENIKMAKNPVRFILERLLYLIALEAVNHKRSEGIVNRDLSEILCHLETK